MPRVLWNSTNGLTSLWSLSDGSGGYSYKNYGPFAGWRATATAVGGNNLARVLWSYSDGTMSLWRVNSAGIYIYHNFVPCTGWRASFLAVGPNNAPRILWVNSTGMISLWSNADRGSAFNNYSPDAGWSASGLAVDTNNLAHVLFTHPGDGAASLRKFAPNNTYIAQNYTPPAGYAARGISAGAAGTLNFLWTKPDGSVQLRIISADGTIKSRAAYPSVLSLTITPGQVGGGQTAMGTIKMNAPALPGGTPIALSSSNPLATVPPSVVVPGGATTATFPVTTTNLSGPGKTTVTLSAVGEGVAKTATLVISYVPTPLSAASLRLVPTTVPGGTPSIGTVTLSCPAAAAGALVSLSSNNSLATVPATVVVPAGMTAATFNVATTKPGTAGDVTATVSAAYGGVTRNAPLTITYVPLTLALTSLSLAPASVVGGVASTGTVPGGTPSIGTVNLSSPACADDNDQWFSDFMSGASSRGYKMDFVAVHCYIRDPYAFLSYIDNLHNRYWQYPLWITEFAPADWSGTNPVSVDEAKNFMKIVVPALNSRWYVARYAWYTGSEPGGSWTLSSAGLVYSWGGLSDVGLLYGRM